MTTTAERLPEAADAERLTEREDAGLWRDTLANLLRPREALERRLLAHLGVGGEHPFRVAHQERVLHPRQRLPVDAQHVGSKPRCR